MPPSRRPELRLLVTAIVAGLVAAACSAGSRLPTALPTTTATTTTAPPATTTTRPAPTTTTTTTTAAPGSFVGTVATLTAAQVSATWRPGCPVGPSQLRLLHLSFWGFDNQPHVGTMVVNTSVTSDVLNVFGRLFAEHFPIYQMQPEDAYGGHDPASMAANNTSGFNCRYAVAPGPPQWSVHAYGEAIDVNTVENPYLEGGTVMPAAGAAYLNRSDYRPGMAVAGGQLVEAFASVGWLWGGRWTTPDYQHFSKTGG
jgi:D-alanyl-D-alanine carboxypeptidase